VKCNSFDLAKDDWNQDQIMNHDQSK